MAYLTPHLMMLDTTSQAIASAGTPQVVTFNTTVLSKKITVTSSSRFTVNEAGDYMVTVTPQVTCSSAGKTLDIWLRVNGTDVANSNCKIGIVNANDERLQSFTIVVPMTAAQYIEVWMNGDSTGLSLPTHAAGVTPTRPVTPSVYLVIEQLS